MAAAEPIWADGMPASPEQAGNETEAAWVTLFLENHLWVDQRDTVSPCCLLDCGNLTAWEQLDTSAKKQAHLGHGAIAQGLAHM
jgi:hypothetical protein